MVTFRRLWRSLIGFLVPFNNKYPFLPFSFRVRRETMNNRDLAAIFLFCYFLQSFIIYCLQNEALSDSHCESPHAAAFFFVCRPETLNNCIGQKENGQSRQLRTIMER